MKQLLAIAIAVGIAGHAVAGGLVRMAPYRAFERDKSEQSRWLRSVVSVTTKHTGGNGVFISPRHVLTAYHVIGDTKCDAIHAETSLKPEEPNKREPNGRKFRCVNRLWDDEERDLSILEVSPGLGEFVPFARRDEVRNTVSSIGYLPLPYVLFEDGCSQKYKPAQKIKMNGSLFGGRPTEHSSEFFFLTDCMGEAGFSGSPFFQKTDDGWEVAGLISAGLTRTITGGAGGLPHVIGNDVVPTTIISRVGHAMNAIPKVLEEIDRALNEAKKKAATEPKKDDDE